MVLTKAQTLRYTKEAFKAVFPQADIDSVTLKNGKSITQNFYALASRSNINLQNKDWGELKKKFGEILKNITQKLFCLKMV